VGLTGTCSNFWGEPFPVVPSTTARALQEIAWAVVSTDPRAGIAPH
jgi:hypothetical protein